MNGASDQEKIELLYKKSLGVPNAYPGTQPGGEFPGNASARIIPSSQIYVQPIPPSVPLNNALLTQIDDGAATGGKRGAKYSVPSAPYIIKYVDCKTEPIAGLRSYKFMGVTEDTALDSAVNIFMDAIPSNFDKTTSSYVIKIALPLPSGTIYPLADDATYGWYFDTAAGVITFWDKLPDGTGDPIVTQFWRYEGQKGLSTSGATGPTGPQGSNTGFTGPTGMVGPTGPAGSGSGPTGATGATGAAGADGATGATGAKGADGATGATGAAGADGATGATGAAGSDGATGATGAAGADGATGATGAAGSDGATGATGAKGADGATGAAGSDGATGATGAAGADGATGATGATGAKGADGSTGATGATGAAGTDGATGATGAKGADGSTGATGATGAAGADGSTGATGAKGADGATGATGAAGADGSTGATGAAGADGATGATGAAGADGSTGATGAAGADGATGATGAAGADGSTGATGAKGADGATGATGAKGADGATGATGAKGADGATGATGAAGTDGATGATGAKGDTGPAGSQDMSWLNTYLLNPPPRVEFLNPTITSTEIRIGWKYPYQITANFFATVYLPYIKSLTDSVDFQINGNTSKSYGIHTNQLGDSYIKTYPNTAAPVQGIILTKILFGGPSTNVNGGLLSTNVETTSISGENVLAVRYYHPDFASLTGDTTTNRLHVYYKGNIDTSSNDATCPFNIFISAQPPSYVQNLAITGATDRTLALSYAKPTSVDKNDPSSSASISGYYANYSTLGSTIRYPNPGAISDLSKNDQSIGTATTAILTGLYPESQYTVQVYAKNNSSNLAGDVSGQDISSTLMLSRTTPFISTLSLASYTKYGNAYLLPASGTSTGTDINNSLVNGSNVIDLTITGMTMPIDLSGTRGKLGLGGAPLAKLEVELSGGALAGAVKNSVTYGDWTDTTTKQVTANGITLNGTAPADQELLLNLQGFYRKATVSGSLNLASAGVTKSRNQYKLIAYESNKDVSNGSLGSKATTSAVTFYYDDISTGPVASTPNVALASGVKSTQISGVHIVDAPSFDISYTVTNAGKYIYRSPYAVYSASGMTINLTNETDLTRITNGLLNGEFTGPITVERSGISGTVNNGVFSTDVSFSIIPYNIFSAGTVQSRSISMVLDSATIALYNSVNPVLYPKSVQMLGAGSNTSGTAIVGRHIDSAASLPALTDNSLPTTYDHTKMLTDISSLQIATGKFVTKQSGGSNAYLNYTGTYYTSSLTNSATYNTIQNDSTYRYATFMWLFDDIQNGNTTQNKYFADDMYLTLHGASLSESGGNLVGISIQYRFIEDALFNTNNNVAASTTTYNTVWIDGSKSSDSTAVGVDGNNFILDTPAKIGYKSPLIGSSTLKLRIPAPIKKKLRLIVRIGLPMNSNISFTHASLYATVV